jgi:hypothetical protein
MELEMDVTMNEKTSSWAFLLTPDDLGAIQQCERVQALAA